MGKALNLLCSEYDKLKGAEKKFDTVEKAMAVDLSDMIEYVKMLSDQITNLRKRSRAAEAVMHQLRKSGESSIESLLETLVTLKKKQEKLDVELGMVRAQVQSKEALIRLKEDEKSMLKQKIEDDRQQ